MSLATITSLYRSLQEWAERDGNQRFLRDGQSVQLRESLGDPSRRTQANVAAWLLGTWHLGNGMLRVLQGEAAGFDEARSGQALRRASLLSRARHQISTRRGPRQQLPFSLLHGAWTALLGLSLHDPGAEPLYELLRQLPDSGFAADDHLPLFVRELLVLRAGQRPSQSARLGPFQDVVLHWQGDQHLLARDLQALLDWHLSEARGSGSALADPACRVYPLLVIADRKSVV